MKADARKEDEHPAGSSRVYLQSSGISNSLNQLDIVSKWIAEMEPFEPRNLGLVLDRQLCRLDLLSPAGGSGRATVRSRRAHLHPLQLHLPEDGSQRMATPFPPGLAPLLPETNR